MMTISEVTSQDVQDFDWRHTRRRNRFPLRKHKENSSTHWRDLREKRSKIGVRFVEFRRHISLTHPTHNFRITILIFSFVQSCGWRQFGLFYLRNCVIFLFIAFDVSHVRVHFDHSFKVAPSRWSSLSESQFKVKKKERK